MGFIQIVTEHEPFSWTPEAEDGSKTQATLMLQVLSDDDLAGLRKKHTRMLFKHGERVNDFDSFGFASDVMDQAIVSWTGVYRAGTGQPLTCDRKAKTKLPDRLKVEILRLCAGREAGRLFDDASGVEDDGGKKS